MGWGVGGQTHPFSRSAKRETQLHNPHHANNKLYYVQILKDQPVTNTMQMVVLHLNLTHQSAQNVPEPTAPTKVHPRYPTPKAWLSQLRA